jgi:hypothetical protein
MWGEINKTSKHFREELIEIQNTILALGGKVEVNIPATEERLEKKIKKKLEQVKL